MEGDQPETEPTEAPKQHVETTPTQDGEVSKADVEAVVDRDETIMESEFFDSKYSD